jgi:hypothetical protein
MARPRNGFRRFFAGDGAREPVRKRKRAYSFSFAISFLMAAALCMT